MSNLTSEEAASAVDRSPSEAAVIDVVSDVVCPWCFIGKRRLTKALELLGRRDVQVRWRAFQLNPSAPKEGFERQSYRIRKFGTAEYARQLEAHVTAAGEQEGIQFRFDRIERIPNTLDAHRLIWLGGREGVQDQVVERLFSAYFLEGEDVADSEALARIGVESGLDAGAVADFFSSGAGRNEVLAEEQDARLSGVNGVPSFFIHGAPVTSGAQKPELLAAALGPVIGVDARCSLEDDACA